MKTMIYQGHLHHLKGKTAQVRPLNPGFVSAQFDERSLTYSGEPTKTEKGEPPRDALGFGWHLFRESDFVPAEGV